MRVVFLGRNHNVLSIACLTGLLECESLKVLVGIDRFLRSGIAKTAARGLRLYGTSRFVRRALVLAVTMLLPGGLYQAHGASLQEVARRKGVSWFECADVNGPDELQTISTFSPDLIVVANFGQILRRDVLSIPPKGCINVHPSMLPKYRGPLPLYWALENKETMTGVSVHYMDEGIDSGDIILQRSFDIARWDTEGSLRKKAADHSVPLLHETIELISRGVAPRIPQENVNATYFSYPRLKGRHLSIGVGL